MGRHLYQFDDLHVNRALLFLAYIRIRSGQVSAWWAAIRWLYEATYSRIHSPDYPNDIWLLSTWSQSFVPLY